MRFYTKQHSFYCGIDLHARLLAICILDQAGNIVLQTQIPADKQLLLKTLAPYRPDVVVAVECLFAWYWVADLCRVGRRALMAGGVSLSFGFALFQIFDSEHKYFFKKSLFVPG